MFLRIKAAEWKAQPSGLEIQKILITLLEPLNPDTLNHIYFGIFVVNELSLPPCSCPAVSQFDFGFYPLQSEQVLTKES